LAYSETQIGIFYLCGLGNTGVVYAGTSVISNGRYHT